MDKFEPKLCGSKKVNRWFKKKVNCMQTFSKRWQSFQIFGLKQSSILWQIGPCMAGKGYFAYEDMACKRHLFDQIVGKVLLT